MVPFVSCVTLLSAVALATSRGRHKPKPPSSSSAEVQSPQVSAEVDQ
jgi:hypothetical protein